MTTGVRDCVWRTGVRECAWPQVCGSAGGTQVRGSVCGRRCMGARAADGSTGARVAHRYGTVCGAQVYQVGASRPRAGPRTWVGAVGAGSQGARPPSIHLRQVPALPAPGPGAPEAARCAGAGAAEGSSLLASAGARGGPRRPCPGAEDCGRPVPWCLGLPAQGSLQGCWPIPTGALETAHLRTTAAFSERVTAWSGAGPTRHTLARKLGSVQWHYV